MATFQLGGIIDIADPVIDGVYPMLPDYDVVRELDYPYIVHKIALKKEQRILSRQVRSTWRLRHVFLTQSELEDFYAFYDAHRKPDQLFYFYDPTEMNCPLDLTGSDSTGRYVCRFAEDNLTAEAIRDLAYSGQFTVCEVNVSTTVPSIGSQLDFTIAPSRKPRGDSIVPFWLSSQFTNITDLVALVVIMPKQASIDNYARVATMLCNITQVSIGGPTEYHGDYMPRLVSWQFGQQLGEGDNASFTFDNNDQVWDAYAQEFDLGRAMISFNIQTGGAHPEWMLKLWRGYITDWETNRAQGTFTVQCEGGIYTLNGKLPRRLASTTCPLEFDLAPQCPYSTQGSGGNAGFCDKSLDGADGCVSHGMKNFFQGVVVKPQLATGKLPASAGSLWGLFGRSGYESTSTALKGIQDTPIPLAYGLGRQIVEGKIFEFRDESEFKSASAIVSDGPIGQIGVVLLDGLYHHYVPNVANPGIHALGAIGQDTGTIIDPAFRSSALSFVSTRVNDEVGIQSAADNHVMLVEVLKGLQCLHTVAGSFDNHAFVETSNPIIIAHDLLARAVGASPVPFEAIQNTRGFRLDIDRYTDAVNFCETLVPVIGGTGTEKRFEFRGILQEQKPAIEWMRDVAGHAPVDIVYTYGMIAFKVRRDEITTPPTSQITFEHLENIIQGTFSAKQWDPEFNEIKIAFANEAIDMKEDSVTLYDEEAQKRIGYADKETWPEANTSKRPFVKQKQLNLTGCFRKSQAVRLGTQLLYEELGGKTQAEQLNARVVEFETSVIGFAVEIGDVSKVIHPDLPDGEAFVRWLSYSFSSDWKVKLSGRTVTASMYDLSGPPQLPGNQESTDVMNFPPLEVLTAPVLTVLSQNYNTGIVGVSPRPALTNWLVYQIDDENTFTGAVDVVVSALSSNQITVAGTAGTSKFVRAKWRRTTDPLEESGWSNTVEVVFEKLTADQIDSVPAGACTDPLVPKIKATYGWNEFIEVVIGLGTHVEGVKALYAGPLTSGAWPKGGLLVENLSSDPTVRVEWVEFIMGSNQAHGAGFVSFDAELLDEAPLPITRSTIAGATNITTLDLTDPGTPKRGVDYVQSFLGAAVPRWVHYVLIPASDTDPTLVCPQDSALGATVPPAYHCDGSQAGSYFGARLDLVQFSASERSVTHPKIFVQIYGRSAAAYSETLQRTFYDPFLPSHPWPGHYGSFYGNNAPASPPARIRVKFSTGYFIDQAATDIANQGAGINVPPVVGSYDLEDYFVFISETAFANDLSHVSGNWWEALADGVLPEGVHLVIIARSSNLMVTNFFGSPLELGQSYHIRVGSRRFTALCPGDSGYLYSATLSEEAIQAIQTTSGSEETPTIEGPAPILGPSETQLTLTAGAGITLVADEDTGQLTVALDTNSIRESSGLVFFKSGTAVVGTNVTFRLTADLDGTFKDWALSAKTAPTGASLIVDINKNGTSIFNNGSARPTLTASSTSATGTVFTLPSFVKGDVFTFDIDQIGSTIAGVDVELQLNFDSPLRLI